MNIKLYNAAYAQLRARAMEALAMIDILLNDPSATPEKTTAMEEITRHTLDVVQYEGAMHALQQYFQPQPAPSTAPPVAVTPEMSPTYKKSLEEQAIKESAKNRSKKKKDE